MSRGVRIGLKMALAVLLIALLLMFANRSVDFVYTGF